MTLQWTKYHGKVARTRADFVKDLKSIVSKEADAYEHNGEIRTVFPQTLAKRGVTLYMSHVVAEADRHIERPLGERSTQEDTEAYFTELKANVLGLLAKQADHTIERLRKLHGEMDYVTENPTQDNRQDEPSAEDSASLSLPDLQTNL
jgi:hypothetical protein